MVSADLNDFDRRLLDQLQREVPLTPRPYRDIAQRLGVTESEVLERLSALSGPAPAPIRQISAIFDSRALGYQSCLVAARVDPARIEQAAEIINRHPGVSHNYEREHAYNLWFTLAVGPDSRLGLERTVELLRKLTGAQQMRLLPSIKMYKIGVKFDLGGDAEAGDASESPPVAPPRHRGDVTLTPTDKGMIRVLQQHLPLAPRPFDASAREAGVTVDELLAAAKRYLELGVMRRFSAVLRHRTIGVSANAMGVWIVPPERCDSFGELAAQYPAVSHCYQRPTYPDWPYSMFTMVHGASRTACEMCLAAISLASGIKEYISLYSTREFKKVRVKYFLDDISRWEAAHAADDQL